MGQSTSKNINPPPYDQLAKCEKPQQDVLSKEQITKMIFSSPINEKTKAIMQNKKLQIPVEYIPVEELRHIIDKQNVKSFKILHEFVDDKKKFQNIIIGYDPLWLYILISNKDKLIEYLLPHIDLKYNNIKNWNKYDTPVHMCFWKGNINLMNKIMKIDNRLILQKNIFGLTPFDYFLINKYFSFDYSQHTIHEYDDLINNIGKNMFLELLKNKTTEEYTQNFITIPVNSTFIEIFGIILGKIKQDIHTTKYIAERLCKYEILEMYMKNLNQNILNLIL